MRHAGEHHRLVLPALCLPAHHVIEGLGQIAQLGRARHRNQRRAPAIAELARGTGHAGDGTLHLPCHEQGQQDRRDQHASGFKDERRQWRRPHVQRHDRPVRLPGKPRPQVWRPRLVHTQLRPRGEPLPKVAQQMAQRPMLRQRAGGGLGAKRGKPDGSARLLPRAGAWPPVERAQRKHDAPCHAVRLAMRAQVKHERGPAQMDNDEHGDG